jgi:aminopeptidase N
MAHDSDPFNRWECAQKLFLKTVLGGGRPSTGFLAALEEVLASRTLDAGVKAWILSCPTLDEIGLALREKGKDLDPIALFAARERVIRALARACESRLRTTYAKIDAKLSPEATDGKARGQRHLKNLCLSILSRLDNPADEETAYKLATRARNLTDRIAGLTQIVKKPGAKADAALAAFKERFGAFPTVMDSWLSVQASARREGVVDAVRRLLKDSAFAMNNPNRVAALLGAFAANPFGLHATDGSGYRLAEKLVPELDKMNPHSAARVLKGFMRWRDYEPKRRAMMKATLTALAKKRGLSVGSREMIEGALKAAAR